MHRVRCNNEIILIDAGMNFPRRDPGAGLGIDVIVPDISFLREHRDQLRAILLTHGHEDHAGGVSFIINEIPVPVYASPLTLGLVRERLKERHLCESVQLHSMQARQPLELGPFQIEPLHVTHSFPDSLCFAISTPAGSVIWTGDFKFDQTPVDGKLSDVARLAHYGEQGVLALFSDSTNSAVTGLAPSEFTMYDSLRSFFRKVDGALIITCFASSIHRIQIILDLAQEFDRKVLVLGRSMISNIQVAADLNYLHFPADLLVPPGQAARMPRHQLAILASGSQGEPRAAMSRLAVNEVKKVGIEEKDLVILSARVIPGSEKLIGNMVNHLYRRGASVFDSRSERVHASGHGLQEDLKLMINLTKPRHFVPIHGEFRQLKIHATLARDQGIPEERIRIIENGDILRLTPDSAEIGEKKVQVGRRFIDEGTMGEVHDIVLRDRRYLSGDGVLVIALRLNRVSGELIGNPELISRGFVSMEMSEDLMEATRGEIITLVSTMSLEEKQDEELFKELLRNG